MSKSSLIKKLEKNVLDQLDQSSFFSLQVAALKNGKLVFKKSFGKKYKYYDLASMTKAIFTASYFHRRPELINEKVSSVLSWLYMSNLTVKDLLSHQSGLDRYKELYKDLLKLPLDERKFELKRILRDEVLKVNKSKKYKPLYSDLGYLILGLLIEELEGKPLDQVFVDENKISGFHFNVSNKRKYKKSLYAPTEKCLWRKRVLQGEVFDDNTHAMEGVAPQAGLFGTVNDMIEFGFDLRKRYKKNPKLFSKINEEWTYGFMIPSGSQSSAGSKFSKKSIGHLGYTGVSFWYDPKVDLFLTILSNRTYPDRINNHFNQFRPVIQNLVYEEFVK